MKKILLVIAVVGIIACNNETSTTADTKDSTNATTMSDSSNNEGWVDLFDGQSTRGWHKFGDSVVGSAWKIENGTLWLDPSNKKDGKIVGGGDIVTDEEYENFHLKVDWKVDTGANSGIMFLIREDKKYTWPWETGPEMQVLDNERHRDAKIPKHRAGDLYDLISVSKETVKPALEWNSAEVRVLNGKLDFWLNGENVVTTTLWDDNWKAMLKNSKWKDHPDFSIYKSGKIGLQDHGDRVWFRNIKIKRL